MSRELARLSAVEIARGYRAGELTASQVVADVLETVGELDPSLNAFCLLEIDHAQAKAIETDRRREAGTLLGPLDGVPVSVKDVVLTSRAETRRGSLALPPAGPPSADAPVVTALEAAGAIVIGKTTTPELGWKAVTDSPLTGTTRNPWDLTCTPGGSSGGAAAAVATGMGAIAIGTDGAGSIRIPASFSGVVGFKATRGRVPLWPPSTFGLLSHVGPLTRTVDDAIVAMHVIGGPDGRDVSFPHHLVDRLPEDLAARLLPGTRVGFCLDAPGAATVGPVRRAVEQTLGLLSDAGAELVRIELPSAGWTDAFHTLWYAGAAQATARARAELLDPGLREIAEAGARLTASDYHRAVLQREQAGHQLDQLMADLDVVLTPTVPILPFAAGREVPPDWPSPRWDSWTPFTWPFNLSGQPAISVPAALSDDGLPIGVQLVARYGCDAALLSLAKAYEAIRPALPWPPLASVDVT